MKSENSPRETTVIDSLATIFKQTTHDYLMQTFGPLADGFSCPFTECFIVICEDGDLTSGRIGSSVKSWWKLSENVVQRTDAPRLSPGSKADQTPLIKVFITNNEFLLGERYSSAMISRRSGLISDLEDCTSFGAYPLIWSTGHMK